MLKPDELTLAVDLHRRSYNLLLWLRTAISKGLPFLSDLSDDVVRTGGPARSAFGR